MSSGFNPAQAMACFPATAAISEVFTWLNLLSFMPVRCWIHSSEVSTNFDSSSFVMMLSGVHLPQPVIVDFRKISFLNIVQRV